MKKLLIASTALSLAGGAAFAEISISGDAEMGVDYDSEASGGTSKHEFKHEVGIDFTASGTTDGGLSFGGSAGFDTGDTEVNTGSVHVSGSFGTLTIGDNDAADLTAGGIAAIGVNDIGVDNMVEDLRGGTAAQLRYDNSFGQISIAISAGTATVDSGEIVTAAVPGVPFNPGKDAVPAVNAVPGAYQARIGGTDMGFGVKFFAPPMVAEMPDANANDSEMPTQPDGDYIPEVDKAAYQTAVEMYIEGMVDGDDDDLEISGISINYDDDGSGTDTDLALIWRGHADLTDHTDPEKFYNDSGEVEVADEDAEIWDALADAYGVDPDTKKLGATAGDIDNEPTAEYAEVIKPVAAEDAIPGEPAAEAIPAVAAVMGTKSETQYAFGMSFDAGGVTIGVGYDSNKTVSMGAGFSAGEVSTNLLYVKTDDDTTGIGADMTYTMGASAVTLAYGREKPEEGEATDAVGMGVTHDLGGGATMNAGFGKVGESNKASIGLMFTF